MTLKDFAACYLPGIYDPRASDAAQGEAWKHLVSLVKSGVKSGQLTKEHLAPFDYTVRSFVKNNWYRISSSKLC